MRKRWLLAAALAAANIGAAAEAGVFVPVPAVPGSTSTEITAINNNNLIAGSYNDPSVGTLAFVGTLDGNYTTFDALSGEPIVRGLNDEGYITGYANARMSDCIYLGCPFLRKPDGTIMRVSKDKVGMDAVAAQIIGHREFIGEYAYFDDQGFLHRPGFYGKNGKYVRDFSIPFSSSPKPRGLAKDGTVTGFYYDPNDDGKDKAFVVRDGVASSYLYPDPNASETLFEQINRKGMTVGSWNDENYTFSRAFIFDSRNELFKPLDFPGSIFAYADGINDAGIATVVADDVSYIYCPHKKTCPITAGAIEVPDRWIPARVVATSRLCGHDCKGQPRHAAGITPADAARWQAADERRRRLPFRH